MSSSSDSLVASGRPLAKKPGPKQARRRLTFEGPLRVYLVVVCADGMFRTAQGYFPNDWAEAGAGLIVGALLAAAWALRRPGEEESQPGSAYQRREALRTIRAPDCKGFVEYPIRAAATLAEPIVAAAGTVVGSLGMLAAVRVHIAGSSSSSAGGGEPDTFGSLLSKWRAQGASLGTLVRVSPAGAANMLTKQWGSICSIAITHRLNRNRLLSVNEPSKRQLAHFSRDTVCAGTDTHHVVARANLERPAPRWANLLHSAESVVKWVRASQHLRDLRKTPETSDAFAELYADAAEIPVSKLKKNLRVVHWELLRRARVRVDCVAMLLFRKRWADLLAGPASQDTHVYLYTDASPQYRGLELYASSFDMLSEGQFVRKMLPMVSLDRSFMDAVGKVLALLWQMWLMTGPGYGMLRAFCHRVRSVTTDQGVERFVANFKCILPDFYGLFDKDFRPPALLAGEMLFPRAVEMPGWMHLWDLVIRKGLCLPKYFPKWLVGLKAIVAFMRKSIDLEVLLRSLRQKGFEGAADLLASISLPSFADWRWKTLRTCCNAVLSFVDTLREHFDHKLFKQARDGTAMRNLMEALGSQTWRNFLGFVAWYCDWLGRIMSWGQGCACHGPDGGAESCPWKGRRLPEAHAFATAALRRGLDEANAWTADTWNCGTEAWLDMQAAVRAAHRLATQKISFMTKVPYLLARLGHPGVKEQCLQQWASCPPHRHHRVSREFLEEGSQLRKDIEALTPEGGNMSARLKAQVQSLAAIPMDDTVAESPHASAHRLMRQARASKWPWVAATMRMQQNLDDLRGIKAADLQSLWSSYTSLLRGPSSRRAGRPMQVKPRKFQKNVYCMSFAHGKTIAATCPVPEFNDDPGVPGASAALSGCGSGGSVIDSGSGGRNPKRGRANAGRLAGGSAASGREASSGQGGGANASHQRYSEGVRLMREFLAAALKPNDFFSFPVPGEESSNVDHFVQVLAMESRPVLVSTFESEGAESNLALYVLTVQMYERWRPGGPEVSGMPNSAEDVFCLQDPMHLDVLGICGGATQRRRWFKWTPALSDVEGCVSMTRPEVLSPDIPLSSDKVPVLCLLDELDSKGFRGEEQLCLHDRSQRRVYDTRGVTAKRAYLQSILALSDLLQAGIKSFPSGQSNAYYVLMLQTRQQVPTGLAASEYKRQLAIAAGGGRDDLDALALRPQLATAPPAAPAALEDAADDSSIVGSGPPGKLVEAPPVMDSENEDDGESDEVFGSSSVAIVQMPSEVLGQRLHKVKGKSTGGWSYHDRLSVSCRNPAHDGCSKSRSLELGKAEFGALAPMFYLGAWLKCSDMPKERHRGYKPTDSEVRSFAEEWRAHQSG